MSRIPTDAEIDAHLDDHTPLKDDLDHNDPAVMEAISRRQRERHEQRAREVNERGRQERLAVTRAAIAWRSKPTPTVQLIRHVPGTGLIVGFDDWHYDAFTLCVREVGATEWRQIGSRRTRCPDSGIALTKRGLQWGGRPGPWEIAVCVSHPHFGRKYSVPLVWSDKLTAEEQAARQAGKEQRARAAEEQRKAREALAKRQAEYRAETTRRRIANNAKIEARLKKHREEVAKQKASYQRGIDERARLHEIMPESVTGDVKNTFGESHPQCLLEVVWMRGKRVAERYHVIIDGVMHGPMHEPRSADHVYSYRASVARKKSYDVEVVAGSRWGSMSTTVRLLGPEPKREFKEPATNKTKAALEAIDAEIEHFAGNGGALSLLNWTRRNVLGEEHSLTVNRAEIYMRGAGRAAGKEMWRLVVEALREN